MGSLIQGDDFQHILRLLNTNVDGKNKIMYAMTAIRGLGRRFSNLVCKKAEVDLKKRAGKLCDALTQLDVSGTASFAQAGPDLLRPVGPAGECSADELERMMGIVANPRAYKIPDWFLNRQKDHKTGRFLQVRSWAHRPGSPVRATHSPEHLQHHVSSASRFPMAGRLSGSAAGQVAQLSHDLPP
jgi:hypothetical protein